MAERTNNFKTLNVGLIGYGGIARVHAMAMALSPVLQENEKVFPTISQLYSVDPVPDYMKTILTDSLDQVINDPCIDLIDICTPNFTHAEIAEKALKNGKSVFLEKPIALNADQAKELCKVAAECGKLNQTGFIYRFMPGVIGLREQIKAGTIGDIIDFKIAAYHSSYLNVNRPLGWNLKKETSGGGPILDLGIHLFDVVRFVLGEVSAVHSFGDTVVKKRPRFAGSNELLPVDVEDWARINLRLTSGVQGIVEVSRVSPRFKEKTCISINGTKGRLTFNVEEPFTLHHFNYYEKVEMCFNYSPETNFGRFVCEYYPGTSKLNWFMNCQYTCLWSFYKSIIEGRKLYDELPDFTEGLKSQLIVEAAYKSLNDGMEYSVGVAI